MHMYRIAGRELYVFVLPGHESVFVSPADEISPRGANLALQILELICSCAADPDIYLPANCKRQDPLGAERERFTEKRCIFFSLFASRAGFTLQGLWWPDSISNLYLIVSFVFSCLVTSTFKRYLHLNLLWTLLKHTWNGLRVLGYQPSKRKTSQRWVAEVNLRWVQTGAKSY